MNVLNNQNKLKSLKEKANSLPLTPGVYIMKNKNGEIIYVGKAKKLKNRVTQYFGSSSAHTDKVRRMVENVDDFEYILCDSEFEAFILENSKIKQYQPKYNILLKDDKGYHYVRITDEKWRRIEFSNSNDGKGKYIGPYNSASVVKETIDETRKIFKLPDCNRSFDKRTKPCLNYHIGICDAPCAGKICHEDYEKSIDAAVAFIKKGGYNEDDIAEMTAKMEKAAENLEFEYAAKLRDRINAIRKISDKQKVISDVHSEQDVFALAHVGTDYCVQLLSFRNGRLFDQKHYFFSEINSAEELYEEFIPRFYSENEHIPKRIITDTEFETIPLIEKWLSDKKGSKVTVTVPKIGEQKKTVDMCRNNASYHLTLNLEPVGRAKAVLTEIADLLGLDKLPEYIESYDISNISGTNNVAGMVVFKNARPYKNAYRRFRIKSFIGQDDFRSMAEVLDRRFEEYEKGKDSAFSVLPDLILLDGGKGQLSAVLPILEKHNISVPVFGMVKDSSHRTRAITDLQGEIELKPTRRAFNFITEVQNEVHRYAIEYHKKSRTKSMLRSELETIEFVGEKTAKALMKELKTVTAIAEASAEELSAVNGVNKKAAKSIYNYFHQSDGNQ